MVKSLTRFIDQAFPTCMFLPAVIIVLVVVGFPTLKLIHTSLYVRELLYNRIYFIGLSHYVNLITDKLFLSYLGHTLVYVFFSVSVGILLGLVLALAMHKITLFKSLFITLLLIPWMIPDVAAGIMWKWMFDKIFGVLNVLLMMLKLLREPYYWLGNMPSAMFCVITVEVWSSLPFILLILYAGLQRIPQELEEAMMIDGANGWQKLRFLTLPYIMPEVRFVLAIRTMFALRAFGLIWIITGGGPSDKTEVLATYIYKTGQIFLRQGYSAAMSMVLLGITILFLGLYLKFLQVETHE